MLTSNPVFSSHINSFRREPIYVIELAWNNGKPGVEGVNDVYFGTADVGSIDWQGSPIANRYFPLLDVESISTLSERVDPTTGVSTIGQLSFTLLDKDQIVSQILRRAEADTGQSMRRQRVELYVLHAGDKWADAQKIRTMQVFDVKHDPFKQRITITANSLLKWLKKSIFTVKTTRLALDINTTAGGINIQVDDVTGFEACVDHPDYTAINGGNPVGFIKIDDEYFLWTSKNVANNTLFVPTGGRGMLSGAAPSTHKAGADVTEVCVLKGNPYELAMRVMFSTGATFTAGQTPQNSWDVYPRHWGAGLYYNSQMVTNSDIDIDQWLQVGADTVSWDGSSLTSGIEYEFAYSSPIEAKQFIEQEILRPTGAFGRVLGDGRYSCKVYENLARAGYVDRTTGDIDPMSLPTGVVLTLDDIVSFVPINVNMQKMSNSILVEFAPKPIDSNTMTRKALFFDQNIEDKHGPSQTMKFKARGPLSDADSVDRLFNFVSLIQSRYSSPPSEFSVELLPKWAELEVGDIIGIDLPIPDPFISHTTRKANTQYTLGDRIVSPANEVYVAIPTIAGVTNPTVGTTSAGAIQFTGASQVVDGEIVWLKHDGHLSRAMEITSVSFNVKTGNIRITAISQPEEFPVWSFTTTASRFADAAYQVGTPLLGMTGWREVSPGNLELVSPTTLPAGTYYYLGNIKIGSTLTLTGPVTIYAAGDITGVTGGMIVGDSKGLAGGKGTTVGVEVGNGWFADYVAASGKGLGYIGAGGKGGGHAGAGIKLAHGGKGGKARYGQARRIRAYGRNKTGTPKQFQKILGVPAANKLNGSGGGAGACILHKDVFAYLPSVKGGDGGAGGAGLCLVCRGIDMANWHISLKGANGTNGVLPASFSGGNLLMGASGGGGGAGGTCVILVEKNTVVTFNVLPNNCYRDGGQPGKSQGWYLDSRDAPSVGGTGGFIAGYF